MFRVLFLIESSEIGGGNRSLLTLWPALRKRGIDVAIVSPADGPIVGACRALDLPCEVEPYPQPSWKEPFESWRAYDGWRRVLRRVDADLIHANGLRSARSISLAARSLDCPLTAHVRFPLGPRYHEWVFRGLPKPDLLFFNSSALLRESGPELRRACPSAVQQVLPNAVDLEIFRPVQKAIDGPLRVGIIANLSPIKGHEDFLAMARELSTSGPACEFWIVGEEIVPSGYRQHIQALAAEMDLTHRIRFIGFESNVAAMINELDVVVSCSRYESFGRSLIEAMACERPVVATAVGGVPEVIEDGMTGFLAPPHMPLRLAAAVRRLLEDRNLRSVIGRQGRLRVEKLFSLDTHVAEIIGHYQQLLGDVGERAERRSA